MAYMYTGMNHCNGQRVINTHNSPTSTLRVTGICAVNSPVTGEFHEQMASNAENVSIWWHHHFLRHCHFVKNIWRFPVDTPNIVVVKQQLLYFQCAYSAPFAPVLYSLNNPVQIQKPIKQGD